MTLGVKVGTKRTEGGERETRSHGWWGRTKRVLWVHVKTAESRRGVHFMRGKRTGRETGQKDLGSGRRETVVWTFTRSESRGEPYRVRVVHKRAWYRGQ